MIITEQDIARFWSKIDKSGDCWIYKGALNKKGYGRFDVNASKTLAHRFAWEITNGEIPNGLLICHKCDNPPCVNPSHLFCGTYSENTIDMMAKGRQIFQRHPEKLPRGDRNGARTHPEKLPRGESHGWSKLTEIQVLEIRASKLSQRLLGKKYGVSKFAIRCVQKRKTWTHI